MELGWYSVIWIGFLTFTEDTELNCLLFVSQPSKADTKISCRTDNLLTVTSQNCLLICVPTTI